MELDFRGDIDLKGLIKVGDPTVDGFISSKVKKFMDLFNPDKVHLERYVDFDSLRGYGTGDMCTGLGLFVFLKDKLASYPELV